MIDPDPSNPPPFLPDPFGEAMRLVPGERPSDYKNLHRQVIASVQPQDMIERIWAGDVVDLIWERHRLVRLRAHVIASSRQAALEQVLREGVPFGSPAYQAVPSVVRDFLAGQQAARETVSTILYFKGYTLSHVPSLAYAFSLNRLERLDRMMAGLERRRDRLLREVERRRKAFAARLRDTVSAPEISSATAADETPVPERE